MSPNYQAWQIQLSDFPQQRSMEDRLRFLVAFAVLAPSSHNSQPWRFHIAGETLTVEIDPARALTESDKNGRQMYVSIGCAIANLLIAADYFGLQASLSYTADGARLIFSEVASRVRALPQEQNHLIHAIARRHTNRKKFDARLPAEDFFSSCRAVLPENFALHVIREIEEKNAVANVVCAGLLEAMDDQNFRRELSEYVHPNITNAYTGMPLFGFNIPLPVSFIAPTLLKHINMNRLSKKEDEALLKKHTPVFCVITSAKDEKADWLRAGEFYERMALMAVAAGMHTAPMAAAIQIGDHFKRLQEILHTSWRPQVFFRLGYAHGVPHPSPRLPAERVII